MRRIKRNDLVEVISGDEARKRGRVIRVLTDTNQVIVQGLNLQHKHVRRTQKHPQGGRVRREAPIHLSKVMLIDPVSDRPTRFRVKIEGDRRVRVAAKSGEALDKA